jgi:hypothetical protein
LAALGLKLQQLDLFGPIREQVQIRQKTVRHTPSDKLYDALIAILTGAHGVVEVNTRLRSDPALQAAFGRSTCAEQSVIQGTLDACDATSVTQMQAALTMIYRQHSQGYRHDYARAWQILDIDMSGLPCGKKAAFASKGYFAKQRNRRGRQLGRVLATRYHEVVVDQLFAGTTHLTTALPPLMEAAESPLELDEPRRQRTIVRIDAGGGRLEDVNWLLARGYHVHTKDYSAQRARTLAASVMQWVDDLRVPGRQVGWVTSAAPEYVRPVTRIAVRCRKQNGQWGIGVVLSTLLPATVGELAGMPAAHVSDRTSVLLAYVYSYDQRGGGVATAIKDDKQGLGLGKRNKQRFEAQQVLSLLGTLAHNIVIWARHWLAAAAPRLAHFGVKRLVRDVFQIHGIVERDPAGRYWRMVLNQAHCFARHLVAALQSLIGSEHVTISLGET